MCLWKQRRIRRRNSNASVNESKPLGSEVSSSSESDTDDSFSSVGVNPDLINNDNAHNDEIHENIDPNKAIVHDTTWHFGRSVRINAFHDSRYKPRFNVYNLPHIKEIDIWMAFFPCEEIDNILECTMIICRI